jgi:hypothetical protein
MVVKSLAGPQGPNLPNAAAKTQSTPSTTDPAINASQNVEILPMRLKFTAA